MLRKFKYLVLSGILVVGTVFLVACDTQVPVNGTKEDTKNTIELAQRLQSNQATPTDLNYSLERYNLIRRAYWVNGMREKANMLVSPIEKPLGHIVLISHGNVFGKFIVDGKVSSLNSYLTPDSEFYELVAGSGSSSYNYQNKWLADVDGSYGYNDDGIFFFDILGNYIEWNDTYLYTDIPLHVDTPVIKFELNYSEKGK
jgi:hypothetical protein